MPEALNIVASLFTIWAQSSILAENKELDRFKSEEQLLEEQFKYKNEMEQRRQEIIQDAIDRKQIILSQTTLGE